MKDPVCGMEVSEKSFGPLPHEGKSYYFCSEHCKAQFEANPNSFLAGTAHARSEPPISTYGNAQQTFTCPMHPEVEQDHPGDCPLCGMPLVPTSPTSSASDAEERELRNLNRRLLIGTILTIPTTLLAMSHVLPHGALRTFSMSSQSQMLQLVLTTPVVIWSGWPFFRRGFKSAISSSLNMFSLISLGVGSAYIFSLIAVLMPSLFPASVRAHGQVPIYFEAAAVIIVLVLFGEILELRAHRRTGSALRELMNLVPPTARKVTAQGDKIIPLSEVQIADILRVVPADRIPVDGRLLAGNSTVDESMITGESIPVEKHTGDFVIGGSMNGAGSFTMRADKIGSDTMLAQIVNLVATAQRSRAPIQALADKVSGVFVPVVIFISIITFLVWFWFGPEPQFVHALISAVSVLIIACPCALGLATPISIIVGVGRAAHEGVLIKDAESLERMERVTTVVVDKTGTLTVGKPSVTDVVTFSTMSEEEILQLGASLERSSEHPVARAIVTAAQSRGITLRDVSNFSAEVGGGVSGTVSGRRIVIGKQSFVFRSDIATSDDLKLMLERLQYQGKTVVVVAVDAALVGAIAVSDPLKDSTPGALSELRELGIEIILATGDNRRVADTIASQLGIAQVYSDIDPAGKAKLIRDLRVAGKITAMAGDGINDAPALAEAYVGIAMGTGTDVAMHAAGITLIKGDLRGIARAYRLSLATMRNIRQNLLFAFLYNALGIPVAAGVLFPWFGLLLSPILAGAAMSLSSVSVIGNALRLRNERF